MFLKTLLLKIFMDLWHFFFREFLEGFFLELFPEEFAWRFLIEFLQGIFKTFFLEMSLRKAFEILLEYHTCTSYNSFKIITNDFI